MCLLNGEVLGRLDEYCGLVDSGDDRGPRFMVLVIKARPVT